MSSLRFVYFDAGGTLLTPHPSVGFHYSEAARRFGCKASVEALDACFLPALNEMRRKIMEGEAIGEATGGEAQNVLSFDPALPYGRTLPEALRYWGAAARECFRMAGARFPESPEFMPMLFEHFCRKETWGIYEDVEPAFALLEARGIPFGVLSNWDARLPILLHNLGMDGRFRTIVYSSLVGFEKPHPEMYRAGIERSGCPSRETAMIGDDARADGFGAATAGWRQCLISRAPQIVSDGLRRAATLSECIEQVMDED